MPTGSHAWSETDHNNVIAGTLYVAVAEVGVPALFHTGRTSVGTGRSPEYFPKVLVQYSISILKRILFGSEWPKIAPGKWRTVFHKYDFKAELRPRSLKGSAMRLIGINRWQE